MRRNRRLDSSLDLDTFAATQQGSDEGADAIANYELELSVWLAEVSQRLAPQQRKVLRLRRREGKSGADTAQLIGRAEGTVKATLHRAEQTLRKLAKSYPPPRRPDVE